MSEIRDVYRKAANGEGQVVSFEFTRDEPKAIIQIVHDISEHSLRYRDFARELNDAGFYVCGNDLVGHGLSKQGHRGCFGLSSNSYKALLGDIGSLFEYIDAKTGKKVPHILIGIGFGAMLSELYTIKNDNIDMIFSLESLAIPKAKNIIKSVANNHIRLNGYNSISISVHSMMYQNVEINGKDTKKNYSWLSTNEDEVLKYIADIDCGFPLTASAYREVIRVMEALRGRKGLSNLPDIPIYLFAGEADQRGNCGKSVKKIATILTETGHNEVAYKLYKSCFHDILHDECAPQVSRDIITLINKNLKVLDASC